MGWLACGLAGGLAGLLAGRLVGLLAGLYTRCVNLQFGCLVGWLRVGAMMGWSAG